MAAIEYFLLPVYDNNIVLFDYPSEIISAYNRTKADQKEKSLVVIL